MVDCNVRLTAQEKKKLRYATDPEYRQRVLDRNYKLRDERRRTDVIFINREREKGRAYRKANPHMAKEWQAKNPERHMLNTIKGHAKRLNIKCTITVEDIVIPKRCPVFGIPLKRGKGRSWLNSPTVDRLDARKGYVKGNVAIISNFANSLKGRATAAQHRRIADWMDRQSEANK